MRQSKSSKSSTRSTISSSNEQQSQSQAYQEPQVLYQIFGTLSSENKRIDYLKQPVPAQKELKHFCPNITSTKCSKSLVNSVTEQMSVAYNTMKIIRDQLKQIDTQVHDMKDSMRVFRYITEEQDFYSEFQRCLAINMPEDFDGEKMVNDTLKMAKKQLNQQGKALLLFNDLRKQLVEYFGGIFCGLCNHGMKDFSYQYKDEYYDYLVIQFNQNSKVKLINILKKINDLQNHLYQVTQIAKVSSCFYGQLRKLDAYSYFTIYENAGNNHQEISDGLELCKTAQSIDNFLNQGEMDCLTLLSYTGPFSTIDYFTPLDKSFSYIIQSFNYINMRKEQKVETTYKDPKGKIVDYSLLNKEFTLLNRPTESKQLYQDFQQTGIDVAKQTFLYESLRALAKKNRPGMFAFMNLNLI